jgi:hypothetical protein
MCIGLAIRATMVATARSLSMVWVTVLVVQGVSAMVLSSAYVERGQRAPGEPL